MRLKFRKSRFAGDRTFQPGEVSEVDDELAGQIVADGDAVQSEEDLTIFNATDEVPKDLPKDPPKPPKK